MLRELKLYYKTQTLQKNESNNWQRQFRRTRFIITKRSSITCKFSAVLDSIAVCCGKKCNKGFSFKRCFNY